MTLTRRSFISTGLSFAAGLGLTPLGISHSATANKPKRAKHVIYLLMQGGMSHVDTFDPKPGTTSQGEFKSIKSSTGKFIGEHLPQSAEVMDEVALIRSMNSKEGSHERAVYFMHTNQRQIGTIVHPNINAWAYRELGAINKNIPGNILISRVQTGSGFLGSEYAPLRIDNPNRGLADLKRPAEVDEKRFARRLKLMKELDRDFQNKFEHGPIKQYGDLYQSALKLMDSEDAKAFDLNQESDRTRKSYGDSQFGQGCLMARRLVERGVRCVEVSLRNWDTHDNNFQRVKALCEQLDRAYATLILDLKKRGLLEQTLVVLTTEFGRTPKVNKRDGRDHYPKAFSAILAGGPVRPGITIGETDKTGERITQDPVSVNDFNASIAHAMGINPQSQVVSPQGRPFTLSNGGKVIEKLFSA